MPTIPREIVKAVSIDPMINYPNSDLTGTFSTSFSMIIFGSLICTEIEPDRGGSSLVSSP